MFLNLKKDEKNEISLVKILNFIITSSIFLIFFFSPMFFTGLAYQGVGFDKMMLFYFLVLIGIVAWVTKGITEGELKIKRTPFDFPIIAVLVIFSISAIFSVNSLDSLIGSYGNLAKGLISVFSFAIFYYLVVNNMTAKKIKMLFWVFLFSSSLVIFYSILQILGIFILPFSLTKVNSFNPLGSLSALSMFSIVILPLLVVGASQICSIHSEVKNRIILTLFKSFLILASLADLAILILLKGFTFWPAAIITMVITLMFFMSKIVKICSKNLIIPLTVFVSLIILLVLGNFNFINLNLPGEVGISRGVSWDIAKSSLVKDPFFGSGPSTFYYSFSKYKGLDFNQSPLWNVRFESASGVLFELLANVGALGVISLIILILVALSICFITLIKTKDKEIQSINLSLFASLVAIIILSLLFSLNNSLILIFILISCFAVSASVEVYHEEFKSINLSLRAAPKYALALSAIFLSVSAGVAILITMGGKMYLADVYAKESLNSGSIEEKIFNIEKAVYLAPYRDVYYSSLANNYLSLANQKASDGSEDFSEYLSIAIENGMKAVEASPNKASSNESLAMIYENSSFYVRGSLEWSETYYEKLAELEPTSPMPHIRMALISMARSNSEEDEVEKEYNIQESIKRYNKAIELKPDLSAAYYGRSVAYEKLSNVDEAIEQLKKAVLMARDNVDYRFELGRLYFNRGMTQANLTQNASQDIATEDGDQDNLSVEQSSQQAINNVNRNEDINLAEQFFLSILQATPNHANARYSLAVLYQRVNEKENARSMVNSLLEYLPDNVTEDQIKDQFKELY